MGYFDKIAKLWRRCLAELARMLCCCYLAYPELANKGINDSDEEEDLFEINLLRPDLNAQHHYPNNSIRTTRYTLLNAFPLSIINQFNKVSNIYFLLVMIIELLPGASPVSPISMLVPFCFVLLVGVVKDLWEDFKRSRADSKANKMKVHILRNSDFASIPSCKVAPGDVMLLQVGEEVKADCMILNTSLPEGLAYIETCNLDGEVNTKMRRARIETVKSLGTVEDILEATLGSTTEHDKLALHFTNKQNDRKRRFWNCMRGSSVKNAVKHSHSGNDSNHRGSVGIHKDVKPNSTPLDPLTQEEPQSRHTVYSSYSGSHPYGSQTASPSGCEFISQELTLREPTDEVGCSESRPSQPHFASARKEESSFGNVVDSNKTGNQKLDNVYSDYSSNRNQSHVPKRKVSTPRVSTAKLPSDGRISGSGPNSTGPAVWNGLEHRKTCNVEDKGEARSSTPMTRREATMKKQTVPAPDKGGGHPDISVGDIHSQGKVAANTGGCGEVVLSNLCGSTTTIPISTPCGEAKGSHGVVIFCSPPCSDLHSWIGQVQLPSNEVVAVSNTQFLPRGCIIRSTDWVLAAVVYTGKNAKIMQNMRSKPNKTTVMCRYLNKLNIYLFLAGQVCNLILCSLSVIFTNKLLEKDPNSKSGYSTWYMQYNLKQLTGGRLFWWRYLTNFVLLSYLIPMSLYVTLEFNKIIQTWMIGVDKRMAVFDKLTGQLKLTRPKTSVLNTQLSQVKYIFTDKTGTLTENLMTYVGGYVAGVEHDEREKPGGLGELFLKILRHKKYSGEFVKRRLGELSASCPSEGLATLGSSHTHSSHTAGLLASHFAERDELGSVTTRHHLQAGPIRHSVSLTSNHPIQLDRGDHDTHISETGIPPPGVRENTAQAPSPHSSLDHFDEEMLEDNDLYRYLRVLVLCHSVVCFNIEDAEPSSEEDRKSSTGEHKNASFNHLVKDVEETVDKGARSHQRYLSKDGVNWCQDSHEANGVDILFERTLSTEEHWSNTVNGQDLPIGAQQAQHSANSFTFDAVPAGLTKSVDRMHTPMAVNPGQSVTFITGVTNSTPPPKHDQSHTYLLFSQGNREAMAGGSPRSWVGSPSFDHTENLRKKPSHRMLNQLQVQHLRTLSSSSMQYAQTSSTGWPPFPSHHRHPSTAGVVAASLSPSAAGGPRHDFSRHVDLTKVYEGPSLDEIALVNAARENGFCLCERTAKTMFVRVMGRMLCYDLLAELEFTPQRKLMSVLLRRNPTGDSEAACVAAGSGGDYHYHRQPSAAPTEGVGVGIASGGERGAAATTHVATTSWGFSMGSSLGNRPGHSASTAFAVPLANHPGAPAAGVKLGGGPLGRLPVTGQLPAEKDTEAPYLLLVKGADNSMFEITNPNNPKNEKLKEALTAQLDSMASKGLRTLVLGQRRLSEQQVNEWLPIFNDAQCSISERSALLHEAYALLEKDIDLIGVTAVEDKLQEEVPETLRFLAGASIVVWMLTGDKRETAIKIAFTSGLIDMQNAKWVFHLDVNMANVSKSSKTDEEVPSLVPSDQFLFNRDSRLEGSAPLTLLRGSSTGSTEPAVRCTVVGLKVESGKAKDSNSNAIGPTRHPPEMPASSGLMCEEMSPSAQSEVWNNTVQYLSPSTSSIDNTRVAKRASYNEAAQSSRSAAAVVDAQLAEAERLCEIGRAKHGETKVITLVLDGRTLEVIFSDDKLIERFFALSCKCYSAVCCRMTPLQKAQIVRLFQQKTKSVAVAVGDGANDVSMIQESRIGISIMGLEGSQAELASDFAIPKFRFLKRLLMVHGRFSMYREANCILYSIYKNIILIVSLCGYNFYSAFSGVSFIDSWLLSLCGIFFVMLQPVAIGTLDKDVPDELAESLPQLYPPLSRERMYFSRGYILKWFVDGIVEGSAYFFLVIYGIAANDALYPSKAATIEDYGEVFFTMLVLAANLRMIITFRYYMIAFVVLCVFVMLCLPLFELIYSRFHTVIEINATVFIAFELYGSYNIYLCIIFVVGVSIVYTISSSNYIQMINPWENAGFAICAAHASPYREPGRLTLKRLKEEYRWRRELAAMGGSRSDDGTRGGEGQHEETENH